MVGSTVYAVAPAVDVVLHIPFNIVGFTMLTAAVNIMQGPYRAFISDT